MEEALSVRTAGVLQISNSKASYINVSVDQFQRMTRNPPSITPRRKEERNELIQTQNQWGRESSRPLNIRRAREMETRLTTRGAPLSEMQRVACLRSPALAFICPVSDLQYNTSKLDSLKFKVYFHV
jgi:hypothetical protein